MGRRRRTAIVAVLLFAAVGGCSKPVTHGSARALPGCVDGRATAGGAASGQIQAGPLATNSRDWRAPRGAKFWVGSHRRQPPTAATIVADRLDGSTTPVRIERGADEIAVVTGLELFYPGLLRIPDAGLWKITVTIGQDTGCYLVTVA